MVMIKEVNSIMLISPIIWVNRVIAGGSFQ